MGAPTRGHASAWVSRARSSARWGSRGRTGRGAAGRGRKRPRRDYETRPAESPAHSSARDRGGAVLRLPRTGRGPPEAPAGSPPCRASPGRWALEEAAAAPWTVRNRAFLCAPGFAGQRKRAWHPAAPTEFRDSQKHTPVPIFLYPSPNGGGG